MSPTDRPVILLAFANDRDDRARYLRNLPEEARRLRNTLAAAERAGLCQAVIRQNATVAEILDIFQQSEYRHRIAVFHYGGHAGSYELLLETPGGQPHTASAAGLAAFLGQQRGLEMAFLNGCSTQRQAQGLLDAGVPAVIATAQAIDDAAATEFAGRFYQGLAGGASLGAAFREAEAAVRTAHGDNPRNLYPADKATDAADRWPWELTLRPGADAAAGWNLPDAAGDPLFGLPPLPDLDLPPSPYRYLDWYRREDAEVFFGRGHEIRDLFERVTAPHAAPIVLLYGQTGVGKSSLLAAGLLPRLERDYVVRYLRRDQAFGLLGTLRQALGSGSAGEGLGPAWIAAEEQIGRPLVVLLDQVEEFYTRPNPELADELKAFLAGLQVAFTTTGPRPQGRLILGFRKEWLAEIEKQMAAHKLPYGAVFLDRLDRSGIIEVAGGPARSPRPRSQYGLAVEDGLPELIADGLLADAGSAVAPILQILLTKMWAEARQRNYDHPAFDRELYTVLRAEGLGLDDFLDQQLDTLRSQQPQAVDSGLALDLLAHHTTPLGTAEQQSLADLQATYAHQREALPGLVQAFQDFYLLVDPAKNQPDQPPVSRLAHDTLAPLVRKRFDESDKPGQRARRILESRTLDCGDGPACTPLDDVDLAAVEGGMAGMRAWKPAEERLVQKSRNARGWRRLQRIVARTLAVGFFLLVGILASRPIQNWILVQQAKSANPFISIANTGISMHKYEVSNHVYNLYLRSGSSASGGSRNDDELPAVNVDAEQAQQVCQWLGASIPTREQWFSVVERGYAQTECKELDPSDLSRRVNAFFDKPRHATKVTDTSFDCDVTTDGILHMMGNVQEWTMTMDPEGRWNGKDMESILSVMGGSFVVPFRSSAYTGISAQNPDMGIGFRCVITDNAQ